MIWVATVLVVLALGGIALVAAGHGAPMIDEYDDRPDVTVPAGDLDGTALRRVRFSLVFRGYRMSEVDALLDRLADQLDARPAEAERWAPQPGVSERPPDDPGRG